nr:hypothetical protein [Natronomonas salina]
MSSSSRHRFRGQRLPQWNGRAHTEQADLRGSRAEFRILGGDGEIARGEESDPVRRGVAVSGGHDRGSDLRERVERLFHLADPGLVSVLSVEGSVLGDIDASGERVSVPDDHDCADCWVLVETVEGVIEIVCELRAKGVQLLGSVEMDCGNVAVLTDLNGSVFG